jgi:hypothetical protein
MKYIITEHQYRIIREQNLSLMGGEYKKGNIPGRATPSLSTHEALQAAGLVAGLFVGATEVYAVGVLLSSLFGAADAALYYREGDKQSAALAGAFALLPYVGKVVPRISGVKELGAKGMALLASKLSSGAKLTNVESQVIKGINANKSLIQQELKTVTPKLSAVNKTVKAMRKPYIEKFGQQKYDDLLREYISGGINKNSFITNLNSASGETYKLANFSVKGGIKFLQSELKGITDLVPFIKNKNFGTYNIKLNVKGVPKNVEVILVDMPNKSWEGLAVGGNKIYVNLSKLEGATEERIRQTLYHEATHIKDPSLISTKLNQSYTNIKNASDDATKNFKNSYEKALNPTSSIDDVKTAITSKEQAKNLYQRYLYHPQEVIANNQMILNNMSSELDGVIQELGPAGAKNVLDNLVGYTSGKNTLSKEALDLLGKDGAEHLTGLYKYNKKYYQNFLKKIAKQSEYLKSQLNLLKR